jgi:cytochrome c553
MRGTPPAIVTALGICALAGVVAVSPWSAGLRAGGSSGPHPPRRLADTGLYVDGRAGAVAPANRPFSPQYPLWTDGATKRRWVYLPAGSAIDVSDRRSWKMPVGTRFWKEFRFDGRPVETRFIWRATAERWVFGSYLWNEDGTDAVLAPDAGVRGAADLGAGKSHRVPAVTDCAACHETKNGVEPLGFNALQLSPDRDPLAPHAEPLEPGMVTLETLIAGGRFDRVLAEWRGAPPRITASSPRTRAALGYLAANCGGCHNPDTDVPLLGASLKPADVADGDEVLRRLLDHRTAWQAPHQSRGDTRLIDPEAPDASALLMRMRSRQPSRQMPPLGTVVADREALELLSAWVAEVGESRGW